VDHIPNPPHQFNVRPRAGDRSREEARRFWSADLEPGHLLAALAEFGITAPLAVFFPVTAPRKEQAPREEQDREQDKENLQAGDPDDDETPAWLRKSPILYSVGRDLTALARAGKLPPVIGREAEQRALARALLRQRKPNAMLVGEAGVGKTGIVEGFATWLTETGVPAALSGAGWSSCGWRTWSPGPSIAASSRNG
jgi:ATP-dependent Clp protease ATP-binding subunit ClpC